MDCECSFSLAPALEWWLIRHTNSLAITDITPLVNL